ncbi:hypothetical protein [Clostridium grantii]|uniref:Uncharacterized protein n=1 Tax=Clostridium grantii DSM 8605 TaxID=1121316 RepID=A0A1M5UYD6_9CLOT|nr:hypothetical protein [Clostridium grantii]SHH68067.1 hypothetical protein SAMN02745207_01998 [Clostridium grantii DSM 8605]
MIINAFASNNHVDVIIAMGFAIMGGTLAGTVGSSLTKIIRKKHTTKSEVEDNLF